MRKPLSGIRVLDFTRLYAGPFCTMLLGDLGADVVKVEMPGGDPLRGQGPPFYHGHGMSFLAANRNKRSIVLDLKAAADKSTARELALKADVIVENFRPGVMARLGIAYDDLQADNPGLVYASISGMGADGPDAGEGAFDLTIQALGGFMSITGERNGKPVKLGTSVFDLVCGQYAMGAIVTALFDRVRTGHGQRIETSLFESEITFLVDAGMEYLLTGRNRERWGSEHATLVPYKAFQTRDGWLVIGAGVQNLFEAFAAAIGRADLQRDPRFVKIEGRVRNRDLLYEILDREVLTYTTSELRAKLEAAKVPCAPVNDMAHVFSHRQTQHRGMVQAIEHPTHGEMPVIGPAVKYSECDVAAGWTAPPEIGEHSDAVLCDWLGRGAVSALPGAGST
ncbi:MAG: CoA transferase [Rhizobiaceae bacterium]|nr:MAG: CoA transferase [Rhizobiaceae bacterium]